MSPATWQAIGIRALVGLTVLTIAAISLGAFLAGVREGRRRTRR